MFTSFFSGSKNDFKKTKKSIKYLILLPNFTKITAVLTESVIRQIRDLLRKPFGNYGLPYLLQIMHTKISLHNMF